MIFVKYLPFTFKCSRASITSFNKRYPSTNFFRNSFLLFRSWVWYMRGRVFPLFVFISSTHSLIVSPLLVNASSVIIISLQLLISMLGASFIARLPHLLKSRILSNKSKTKMVCTPLPNKPFLFSLFHSFPFLRYSRIGFLSVNASSKLFLSSFQRKYIPPFLCMRFVFELLVHFSYLLYSKMRKKSDKNCFSWF